VGFQQWRMGLRIEGLYGAAETENAIDLFLGAHIVHLPDIEVIGLESSQGSLRLLIGFFPSTAGSLLK